MRVESEHDRKEKPEECDGCSDSKAGLTRYYSYGPGHQVRWLCPYCEVASASEYRATLSAMFNVLERRLRVKNPRTTKGKQ
jgi:hypothetical protein